MQTTRKTTQPIQSYLIAETPKLWSLEHETFGTTTVDPEAAIKSLIKEIPADWDMMDFSMKIYSSREIMLSCKMDSGIDIAAYQQSLKLHTLLINFFESLFCTGVFAESKKESK